MSLIIRITLIGILVYVGFLALLVALQKNIIFRPDRTAYTQNDVGVAGFDEISVTTKDDLILNGWYTPAKGNTPTIIMFHGNASTYQWRAPGFMPLVEKGYGLLLVGYRGYGGNPGTPSEEGFYQDAESFLNFLENTKKIKRSKIILYGESLGTGVAIEMASRRFGYRALILENAYTSLMDLMLFHYPYARLVKNQLKYKFDSRSKIEKTPTPKLFLIAGRDRVVPPAFGQELFDLSSKPKARLVYPEADHVGIKQYGALNDIHAFLSQPGFE